MTTATGFEAWIGYVNSGDVDWATDTFALFLTNTAPNAATNAVLADITEVSYTNLSSRMLVLDAAGEAAGTYTATFDPLVLTASGAVGPFRYVGVYDDTPAGKPLVCFYDYGSSIIMGSGDTLTFTPSAATWTDAPL
jgi:hypothetical protein